MRYRNKTSVSAKTMYDEMVSHDEELDEALTGTDEEAEDEEMEMADEELSEEELI